MEALKRLKNTIIKICSNSGFNNITLIFAKLNFNKHIENTNKTIILQIVQGYIAITIALPLINQGFHSSSDPFNSGYPSSLSPDSAVTLTLLTLISSFIIFVLLFAFFLIFSELTFF